MRRTARHPHRSHRLSPLAQAAAMAALLASPLWLQAQTGPRGLPNGLQVVQGQASVATQGTQMTVKNSAGAILNWQSFSIGAANGVHFQQAGAASKVLNRVVGNDPSAILGSLTSNGQVWLLNPNGVLFGQGARVDVAGLVTSTLRLNDNDFLAGRYRFSAVDGDRAGIRNEGALTSSFGGQVVLLGESVENAGRITAPGGSVNLAAARSVELVDTGLPNLTVKVSLPAGEVLNLGALAAPGGTVDVYGGIVNQSGFVQADTLGTDTLGRVVLHAADTLTLSSDSLTRAAGSEAGAAGGAVDLFGAQVAVLGRAVVDVSGDASGGGIRLGGGEQGRDRSVPNARAVWFGPEATLRADAAGAVGDGGRIVLWSDEATRAYGTLSARGGSVAGDGGFIETSGGWLDARPAAVRLAAPGGRAGLWLLDPNDILINDAGPDTNITGGPSFTSTDDNSVISTATIAAALNAGTSVTVATGTGGSNSQPGDVFFDAATINVNPSAPVTFTVQAARDIVVFNSTITSTGQPLSLDLQAAGSGIGAIEILQSTLTTAGGNVTLGGTVSQQLPLPGGGLTATFYRPAVGYLAGSLFSSTSSGGETAVAIEASTLNLGTGTLRATGYTTVDNRDGVQIGGNTGDTTTINAGTIEIVGYSSVLNPVNIDVGVIIRGDDTNLTATQSFAIEGAGRIGVAIEDGARLALNAAPASGASFTIRGEGDDFEGVGLYADDIDLGIAGRGTRLTLSNAALVMTGNAISGPGILMSNDAGAPGPILDLSAASASTLSSTASGFNALEIRDTELVLTSNATTTLQGNGLVSLTAVAVSGENATLSMSGSGFSINASTLAATTGTLALDFATTGPSPRGVLLENTIIDTGGGDLRFGALQIVGSSVLGNTAVAAPWVETVTDNTNYSGGSLPGALWLLGSTIDAGSGRVYGGGAARTGATGTGGVTLDGSIINAREVALAGRSEDETGINVVNGTYRARTVFSLDGLTGAAFFGGLYVAGGSSLQLDDPAAATGSRMSLIGRSAVPGPGIILRAGNVGSGNDTLITVNGAELLVDGSTVGGNAGIFASGESAAPGGLLINALGATAVTLNAANGNSTGPALTMSYMNLLGPQSSATSPLNISASGGRLTGTPSTVFTGLNLSSAGPVNVLTDGLQVTDSQLGGDAGLALRTRTGTGGRAEAPIAITGSTLAVNAAGAELRIEGSQGDAVRGLAGYESGQGVTFTDSSLLAGGAGARIVANGRGSDSSGTGLVLTRSTLTATQVDLVGSGTFDGNGVVATGDSVTPTVVNASNLNVTGTSANSDIDQTYVGVHLDGDTRLSFSGAGVAQIIGDTVLLGPIGTGAPFRADGAVASFTVSATGSLLLNASELDFSAGGGTNVTLRADSDGSGAGRLRLIDSTVLTGGGSFTGAGQGVYAADVLGNPQVFNATVREGVIGVLLEGSNLVDTGTGVLSLTGTSAADGRGTVGSAGVSGIGVAGSTELRGDSISLQGSGGDAGAGIDTVGSVAGSTLNLVAGSSIRLTGTGVGTDGVSGVPLAGVLIGPGSVWDAGALGTLDITSVASALSLQGLTAVAGDITLDAGGPLTLDGSSFSSSGAFSATANGPTINGSLFSLLSTTVTAGGALTLDATATTPGVALSLLSGVALTGGSVSLSGTASGDPSNAPGISAVAPSGSITATSGTLDITGRNPALDTEGILLEGPWVLQAPNVIDITSDGTTLLRSPVGFSGSPTFSAAQAVNLTINSPFGINLGDAASALDANTLGIALAGQSPTSTFTLTVSDPSGLLVDQPFSLPARLQVRSALLAFSATGSLTSTAPGDAIVLDGVGGNAITAFDNQAGPGALSAPNGRWVVQLQDPASANLGGLAGDFTAYNLAALPWAVDASGNLVTPAAGNAIGYAVAPAVITGTALGGLLDKVYDASTGITLDPLAWTVNGLLAGDTLTLSGATTATLADKNVGSGKAVTLNPASVFTVFDASGNPVFGYDLPVFTATVTPAQLLVSGMSVASKVYDGTTVAPVTGTPAVTPLGTDVVGVASISASFSDKNVGTNKLVAYTGVTLSGVDAGNYFVQLPVGAIADITPLALPVTGLTASNKVYDGTTLATLNGTAAVGALAGDSVLLAGSAAASFADKNVGTAKAVTLSGLTLTGTDAGNYTLVQPAALTADITPLALALTGLSAGDKVYDATTVAPLTGTASINPLAGDTVTLAGTAVGSFGDKNVGTNKLVGIGGLTLAGTDAGNYQLTPPVGVNASITPAVATVGVVVAGDKVYDATTAATASAPLTGVFAGDAVTLTLAASFADANVGVAKSVSVTPSIGGVDAGNYTLSFPVGGPSPTASITPATLVYVADALTLRAGSALPLLTGGVTGFVGGETLAGATTGTLVFTTPATASSPAGSYAIDGSGLAAANYQFVQAAGNATALTLGAAASSDPATAANQVALMLALQSVQVPLAMSSPVEGRVLDVTPAFALGGEDGDGGLSFRAVNFSLMPRDEVQSLLAARASYKKKVFANSLSKLELDPALADVPPCKTEAELDTGNCLVTEALKKEIETIAARAVAKPRKADRRKVRQAALPNIERKLALLIGINTYDDKRVPELGGAVPDVRAVRQLLEGRLGYETTVVENAKRETIIRAFNRLALDADAGDSVVVYYAGHGEVVPVNGVDVGYWLPADVNPDEPKTWMSNSDIARMVAAIGARQMMLVSDSCYSGTLVGSEKVQLDQRTNADELLKRKAAVVLSSGGNEPVADEGRDGHSVFAWHFMRAMEALDQWQVGTNVFERVRAAVVKDFPQTPQYGASRTAGHQGNTDYLFERREFEAVVPVPVQTPVPAPQR